MDGNRTVMVTGAGGFVGVPVVAELCRRGVKVRAVDSNLFGTLSCLLRFPGVTLVMRDYRDLTSADLAGVTDIIHLAALPNDPCGELFDEETCLAWNGHCVVDLAKKAKRTGCLRFTLMSTCSVYGAKVNSDDWCDENSHLDPISTYARAKVVAEQGLTRLHEQGLDVIALRSATLFGFSSVRTRLDLPVNRFCMQAHWHGKVWAFGEDLWRPFFYVTDAARAIVDSLSLPHQATGEHIINMGNSVFNWRLGEAAAIVAREFGVPLSHMPMGHDSRSYRVSFDRFKRLLPHAVPQVSLEEGVRTFGTVLRAGCLTPFDEHSPRANVVCGYKALLASEQVSHDGRLRQRARGLMEGD